MKLEKCLFFSCRTQRHVLELIKELGLEVYPQFNDGKKVLHVGGAASKVRAYKTSIPALSPLVLLDMSQLLWKVRPLPQTKCCCLFVTVYTTLSRSLKKL